MERMVPQVHQDYLENQETPEYVVLGPPGKLDRLVRTVHLVNLG